MKILNIQNDSALMLPEANLHALLYLVKTAKMDTKTSCLKRVGQHSFSLLKLGS